MFTDVRIEKIDDKNILIKYYFDKIPPNSIRKTMENVEEGKLYSYLSEVYNVAYVACSNSTITNVERDVKGEKEIMQEVADTYTNAARQHFKKHFGQANEECPFTDEEINNMSLEQINDFLEQQIEESIKNLSHDWSKP